MNRYRLLVRTHVVAMAIAGALLASASPARAAAPTKQQCIAANENAQSLRQHGKLRAARALLLTCVVDSCPGPVRDDCAERLDELDKATPTLVLVAKAHDGVELRAVKVTVDGEPLAERLDGRGLVVDPGDHVFELATEGRSTVTRRLLLREGEKSRVETIVFGEPVRAAEPARPPPAPKPVLSPQKPPPPQEKAASTASAGSAQRVAGLVVGGAGLVALGLGVAFGASASSSWSSAQSECSTGPGNCPSHALAVSDHDSAVTAGTVSTVAFIAGGALLTGGLVLYFTAPKGGAPKTGALGVTPSIGPTGGSLQVLGRF
jgi:hypothetical protein